jgi:hypothetical protein
MAAGNTPISLAVATIAGPEMRQLSQAMQLAPLSECAIRNSAADRILLVLASDSVLFAGF